MRFPPLRKSILLLILSIKTCGLEFLPFTEFINIVSILCFIDLIMLLYIFLENFFTDTMNKLFA